MGQGTIDSLAGFSWRIIRGRIDRLQIQFLCYLTRVAVKHHMLIHYSTNLITWSFNRHYSPDFVERNKFIQYIKLQVKQRQ